jgi:hypothetical protein
MYNIIVDSQDNEQKKWNYTNGLLLYNVNYFLIYKLHEIIIPGDFGIPFFINKIKKIIKFIKNDTNTPLYIKENTENLLNFQDNIENNSIIINKYTLYPLTNNTYLSSFVIRIIDIMNRYFKHIASEYNTINFGFYIPNEDKTGDYIKTTKESLILAKSEINNIVHTINQYREDKIGNNFEIKYQSEHIDNDKINDISELTKLNFIITYGYYFTYDNKKLLKYIDKKLIDGGNLILVANMDTPIKSLIVKELLGRFKKSIITKATLDDPFNWIFIGKGYISSAKNEVNTPRIKSFINNTFIKSCINFDQFLNDVGKIIKLDEYKLVNEINKKYIEIYRWCLNNNIEAINLFSDTNKEPKLVTDSKMLNYFFPNQHGVDKTQLKIFDITLYSITMSKEADIISMTIKNLLKLDKINRDIKMDNIVITDGTANVGGNTLSFSSHFKKVNSIEYNHKTFEGLKHNCQTVYKRKNIEFYEGDCTKIIPKLKQDVIFIDPPWNGLFYKAYDKLHLKLSNVDCFDILSEWIDNKKAKLYCLKCPSNFDFDPFINKFKNIYLQKLKNLNVMYILDLKM